MEVGLEFINDIPWGAVLCACLFMVMDVVTGFTQAAANGDIKSSKMRQGMWHKLGFLLGIAFSVLLSLTISYSGVGEVILEQYGFNVDDSVTLVTCAYVVVCEAVSIIENIGKITPEIGTFLTKCTGITGHKDEEDGGTKNV